MTLRPADALQRRLLAAAVALLLLLALTTALFFLRPAAEGWRTPLGTIAPLDLLAVALSMAVGGAIARRDFRGWAVALVVIAGVASAVAAYGAAPAAMTHVGDWLLRNTVLQMLLSALVAWAAAYAGEQWAARRARAA
jgi:hypothetical protein